MSHDKAQAALMTALGVATFIVGFGVIPWAGLTPLRVYLATGIGVLIWSAGVAWGRAE